MLAGTAVRQENTAKQANLQRKCRPVRGLCMAIGDMSVLELGIALTGRPEPWGLGGRAAHGLLMALCRDWEPDLSAALHDGDGPRPFSLSPLIEGGGGEGVCFRVALLDGHWGEAMVQALERVRQLGRAYPLAGAEARITTLRVCEQATYENLLSGAGDTARVRLGFQSPTLFRRSGMSVVFPQPELVFGSLLRTWNSFASVQLPSWRPEDLACIMVSDYSLRTELVEFGDYRLVGFSGEVSYRMPKDAGRNEQKAINCLADFVSFAGVGYKTTMGMGQCRRLD